MICLILLFPLFGFIINGLVGRRLHPKVSGGIGTFAIFLSFVISVMKFLQLLDLSADQRVIEETSFQWLTVGDQLQIPFKLVIDPLSSVMSLVITGVGTLIHLYSVGYMEHDETPSKFFTYLNLFCFAMLALVLGGNLPILFLGWEGVGLCSYLLIGYWYQDSAKASAGKKAFVVNRVGDLGFLIGIFIIFGMFGSLDFATIKTTLASQVAGGSIDIKLMTIATMCLFVGAMGKSAQVPLYVWLPDAMAGPTPVSALIHAATMVTAGVYMIARMNFMFSLCPSTLILISGIGAVTALFAATIALVQTDIKKVLAYSTVSQLGYMFVAVGVASYVGGVFHLVTHAFFKALLFLGSGSVIHGMHEEQDIMKMGGLKKYMPITFYTFAIGTIAIAGIPPFAGFFSKDEILWEAFSSHHGLAGPVLWAFGSLTALLTSFYMTRLTCLTFLGKERFDHHKLHPHESPLTMTIPLIILAVLSALGGFLGVPGSSWIGEWLSPVFGGGHVAAEHDPMEYILMGVSAFVGLVGMSLGYYFYVKNTDIPKKLKNSLSFAHKTLTNKYYVDEFYENTLIKPIHQAALTCWKTIDVVFVDGTIIGIAKVSQAVGESLRVLQTGSLQAYAVSVLIGIVFMAGYMIYVIR